MQVKTNMIVSTG